MPSSTSRAVLRAPNPEPIGCCGVVPGCAPGMVLSLDMVLPSVMVVSSVGPDATT
jgi:hypothetical protein